jgi:hypothetical protein
MTMKPTDSTGGDVYYLSDWVVVVRMKGWNMQLKTAFIISILYTNNSSAGFIIEQKTRW